jgi:multidrug resistance efflux pump
VLVAQSAAATQASYQISTLKQEQARLTAEADQLQAQLAQAQAANRVAAAADSLGMTHPGRWQYLNAAPGSPIALAPAKTDTATGSLLKGVLAAIGTAIER